MKNTFFLIFSLLFNSSCIKNDVFLYSKDIKPDEHGIILWESNDGKVFLRSEIENSRWMSDYKIYLSINRIFSNDTVSFYLLETNNGKFRVNNNRLYIYGQDYNNLFSKNFYMGWVKVKDEQITNLNYNEDASMNQGEKTKWINVMIIN